LAPPLPFGVAQGILSAVEGWRGGRLQRQTAARWPHRNHWWYWWLAG